MQRSFTTLQKAAGLSIKLLRSNSAFFHGFLNKIYPGETEATEKYGAWAEMQQNSANKVDQLHGK